MPTKPKILLVYGTRPEAIKVAPVALALRDDPDLDVRVAVTGQHENMVEVVNEFFGITPDTNLHIAAPGQSLNGITARTLTGLDSFIRDEKPDMVLVHGDTTTSTAAALTSFNAHIPVTHLEAGLRSNNLDSPYPEEGNRRLTGQITSLHLAPTSSAKDNLLREGADPDTIVVTGNTVIDALHLAAARAAIPADPRIRTVLSSGQRLILVTGHRRESWEHGLADVARALAAIADAYSDTVIVLPMHPNPIVRAALLPDLEHHRNVLLTEPLPYPEFCRVLSAAYCVVTDSGGLQEEAPSLGVPVLVTRETTERPEAVALGAARLVGTATDAVTRELMALLDDPAHYADMSHAGSPYGDGHAAPRALAALKNYFGRGERLHDFTPATQPLGAE